MDEVTENRTQAADLTMALAEGASALGYDDLPATARAIARQCVLDYLGVALAGAADPTS
jgi:2-methylcitrate dehydratase PrpD